MTATLTTPATTDPGSSTLRTTATTSRARAAAIGAITYLQRDAHLPQTGVMDAATQQALVTMLAHGNKQMGS